VLEGQIIWIVIFAFYVLEHVKLIPEDGVLASETTSGVFDLRIAATPFLMLGKQLMVLAPIPRNGIVRLGSMSMKTSLLALHRAVEVAKFKNMSHDLRPLLSMEPYIFVLYFVVMPLITHIGGLILAILFFIPVQIIILFYVWWILSRLPPLSGIRKVCRWCIALEVIIAPGVIPALGKRLCLNSLIRRDAIQIFTPLLARERTANRLRIVRYRVEEMLVNGEISEKESSRYLSILEIDA